MKDKKMAIRIPNENEVKKERGCKSKMDKNRVKIMIKIMMS